MLPIPIQAPPRIQAAPTARPADAEAVAAAERSFAADAARLGTHAAFLAHLAADGLVFMPLPANGREIHGGRAEDGSLLSWGPSFVEVAASGDFAVSTGPWSWRAKGETAPAAFGHFLSLWVRREGRWQVRLDIGVSHPAQEEPPLRLSTLPASTRPAEGPEAAWAAFDGAAARDLAGAMRGAAAPDLRLYRKGHAITPGNLAVLAEGEGGGARWEASGREAAASRDLAFRWGERSRGGAEATVLQVWRRQGGSWRLAMDVALPHPPGP